MSSSTSTTATSLTISLLTSILALFIVSILPGFFNSLPSYITSILLLIGIPLSAYLLSVGGSVITQYTSCNKVELNSIFITNLFVLASTGFATFILYMESLPILKYIFGTYAPTDPSTGLPLDPSSEESEKHYKIQFFSNIVKSVLPLGLSEIYKDGFAAMYWIFFLTLLPTFFLFTLQGSCSGPK